MKKLAPYLLSLLAITLLVWACGKDDEPATPPVEANNAPTIEAKTLEPDENIAPGTNIGSVDAKDDDGDTLSYALTGEGPFVISATGTVSLAEGGALDFETTQQYILTVTVEDASASASATLTINVQDINEPPTFNEPSFTFDALENLVEMEPFGEVTATDPEGVELEFTIVENDNDLFAIDSKTGKISVASGKMLDFESFAGEDAIHTITVSVSDGENPEVTIAVTISVNDVEEDPNFEPNSYEFEVAENSTEIGNVEATDPQQSPLEYALTGGPEGLFTIDENGAITVAEGQVLNFEEEPNVYELTVAATDPEGNTDQAPVRITVSNVDEIPILTSGFEIEVNENIAEDFTIVELEALDPEGNNVTFFIDNSESVFELTQGNIISLANGQNLDFEELPNDYELDVLAFDGVNEVIYVVNVRVQNVEDADPKDPATFVTSWETTEPDEEIRLYVRKPDYNYNFTINWGDGTIENLTSLDVIEEEYFSHIYEDGGNYTVGITGTFPALNFGLDSCNQSVHAKKLMSIDQWGTIQWRTMRGAFTGCSNFKYLASDLPNLTEVTNTSRMFSSCTNFNGNLGDWNIATITDMSSMFSSCDIFTGEGLQNWEVQGVTNMSYMFNSCDVFTGEGIQNWNVQGVLDMEEMFRSCGNFNADLGNWNTQAVENMHLMFANTPLFTGTGLENWNTQNVTDMAGMFLETGAFDVNLGNWDISSIEFMNNIFKDSNMSSDNYSATLIGWATEEPGKDIPQGVIFSFQDGMQYCTDAEEARTNLIMTHNWDFENVNDSPTGANCNFE
ncbi:MAG: BspA family leucine-rich repeat surface protein [Bacteroidota bacterium]